MTTANRWQGRNADKDRIRQRIWDYLRDSGVGIGPVHSRIPNFAGADLAAFHLSRMPQWQQAKVIKCNPDAAQIPVRLRALYDGKTLFAPVPELTQGIPFVRLEPQVLEDKGVNFELAVTSAGFLQHGEPAEFEDMPNLDLVVVGSVAVHSNGARTGKGGGFADLELGIFRELGKVSATTPLVTTVHSSQVVTEDLCMQAHDSPLDIIVTEEGVKVTNTVIADPVGVSWEALRQDQYRDIPFLQTLRQRLERA